MALELQGFGGTVADVSQDFRALRVEVRPCDMQGLGMYSYGSATGILPAALAANSEIFQFRWADATRVCLIRKVRISACVSTTFFAAGVPVQIDMVKSTGWTVQGTGGVGVAPAAQLKKRTAMPSTLLATGDMRIATTAALGAGTKTLETVPLGFIVAAGPITGSLNGQIIPPGTLLFDAEVRDGGHPIILAQNEGFSIRSVAVPATGTWMAAIDLHWTEMSSY